MSQTATAPSGDPRHRVTISVVRGQVQVDPKESFRVSKSRQEEVIWEGRDVPYFTVEFKNGDSPFYESQFNSDFPASGLVRRSVLADEQRTYEYIVRVPGAKELDPDGVVTK